MVEIADVSIIMPNYNHSKYLEQSIRSVLSQSVRPREFIIVDDCSTDNSLEIMRRMQKEYPWIEVIANEKNMGPLNIVNEAGERATSKYLYFLPADDFVLPGFLEQFTKACEECSDFALFRHYIEGIFYDVSERKFLGRRGWDVGFRYVSSEEILMILEQGGENVAWSPVYRKDAWLNAGKFIVDLGPFADWFCIHVIAARHGVFNSPEVLLTRRFLNDSYVSSMSKQDGLINIIRLLSTYYEDTIDFFSRCRDFTLGFGRFFLECFEVNNKVFVNNQVCLKAFVRYLFSKENNYSYEVKESFLNKLKLCCDDKTFISLEKEAGRY